MLKRCKHIETKRLGYGIMTDKPGAGKTNVILALIMSDKDCNASTNVVVVPQNIYTQWAKAIECFPSRGFRLTYAKYIFYSDVTSLYYGTFKDVNIILTTPLYFNVIADAAAAGRKPIRRVIVDEIDSVNFLVGKHLQCETLWLVSASFTPATLKATRLKVNKDVSDAVTCKCEDAFVEYGFPLPPPVTTTIVCTSTYIDTVLRGILSPDEIAAANALDFSKIKIKNIARIATNEKEALEFLVKDLLTTVEVEERNLLEYAADSVMKQRSMDALQEAIQKLQNIKDRLRDADMCLICCNPFEEKTPKVITSCCKNVFCSICLETWYRTETACDKCPMCRVAAAFETHIILLDGKVSASAHVHVPVPLVPVPLVPVPLVPVPLVPAPLVPVPLQLPVLVPSHPTSCFLHPTPVHSLPLSSNLHKLEAIQEILTSRVGEKTIVFSDHSTIFKSIAKFLDKQEIPYVELDGGNIESIDASVTEYKYGVSRVLMTNSSFYGCGMNLENTSDILFVHKTNDAMHQQIVGRAQRPGRVQPLNIFQLLHANEDAD
jgi:hypothetical protein